MFKEALDFYGTFIWCKMQKIIHLNPAKEKNNESSGFHPIQRLNQA